jgi:hypothetical protein
MARIGRKAILEFRRKLIPPVIVPPSALRTSESTFLLETEEVWTGEEVVLVASVNNIASTFTGYLHVDELGVASIHSTILGALANDVNTKRNLSGVQPKIAILAMAGHPCQTLELLKAYYTFVDNPQYASIEEQTIQIEPALYEQYQNAGPAYTPFKVIGDARQWTLNTSGEAIDTSVISEKYFNGIKAVISGSGTIDFLVEIYGSETLIDSCNLLRMTLLTGDGAEGLARFYLGQPDSTPFVDANSDRISNKSEVFYSAKVLLTNSVVTPSADGLIVGSADFVATGPLKLGVDIEPDRAYLCDAGETFGDYNSWRWSVSINPDVQFGDPANFGTNSGITYGSADQPPQSAWVDSDGSIYVYGTNQDISPVNGYILSKFSANGVPLWTRRYLTSNTDPLYTHVANSRPPMTIGEDGSIWIVLYQSGILTTPRHQNYVAKINPSNGDVISSFCFSVKDNLINSPGNLPFIYNIAGDDQGFVYLAMQILYPAEPTPGVSFGDFRFRHVICKVNASGNLIWSRGFRGDYDGFFRADRDIPVREMRPKGNRLYLFFNGRLSTGAGLVVLNRSGAVVQQPTGYSIQRSPAEAPGAFYTNLQIMWMDFDEDGNIYLAVYYAAGQNGGVSYGYAAMKINGSTYNVEWFRTIQERSIDNTQAFDHYASTSIYVDQGGRLFLQGVLGRAGSQESGFVVIELNPASGDIIASRKVRGRNTSAQNNSIVGHRFMKYREPSTEFLHFYYEQAGQVTVLEKQGQFGSWPITGVNSSWNIYAPNLITFPNLPAFRYDIEGGPEVISNIAYLEDIQWVNYGKQVVSTSPEKNLFATVRVPIGQYTDG